MNNKFEPQVTTRNALQEIETELYTEFQGIGYTAEQSRVVAHAFTQFALGYVTGKGVGQKLIDAGIEFSESQEIVELFQEIVGGPQKSASNSPKMELPVAL